MSNLYRVTPNDTVGNGPGGYNSGVDWSISDAVDAESALEAC